MRLLISGGGTGGHVYPALSVATEIRNPKSAAADPLRQADVALLYVGRAGAVEERLARQAGIAFEPIVVGGVRGLYPQTALRNLGRMVTSVGHVRRIIRTFKPTVAFATGGYVSAPVIWAAAAEHIPSIVYLPDLEPGWAVRATARWATRVAISFPQVARYFSDGKAVVTGYPVRPEFFATNRPDARTSFQLRLDTFTITILGGSHGARSINQAVMANLVALTKLAQVIHIAGREDEAWVKEEARSLSSDAGARLRVYGYLDDQLAHALAAADIVVARAGAATLGEFPALGLPAILVPYPHAGRHQERNAAFLVERGAAIQVDDAALGRELIPVVTALHDAPEKLVAMSTAARSLAEPCAAANIAHLLYALEAKRS